MQLEPWREGSLAIVFGRERGQGDPTDTESGPANPDRPVDRTRQSFLPENVRACQSFDYAKVSSGSFGKTARSGHRLGAMDLRAIVEDTRAPVAKPVDIDQLMSLVGGTTFRHERCAVRN